MTSRILTFLLPLFVLGAAACTPADEPPASTAEALSANAVDVGLHGVAVAVYDLTIHGRFPACVSSSPEVAETHLVQPRERHGVRVPGTLSIVVADPNDLDGCPEVVDHEMSFRIRLDAQSALASDPEAIHQMSLHMDSDYALVLNGTKLGVVSVGLPYIMVFDDGK